MHWWVCVVSPAVRSQRIYSSVCLSQKVAQMMIYDPKVDRKSPACLNACDSWSQQMCDRVQVVSFSSSWVTGQRIFPQRTILLTSLGSVSEWDLACVRMCNSGSLSVFGSLWYLLFSLSLFLSLSLISSSDSALTVSNGSQEIRHLLHAHTHILIPIDGSNGSSLITRIAF